MFTVYHSNELEVLVDLCINNMENQMQKDRNGDDIASIDPFAVKKFVVQRPEIFTYLKQRIAMKTGIATQLASSTIWSYIWEVGRAILEDEFPERCPYDRAPLTLNIMSVLERGAFDKEVCFTDGESTEKLPPLAEDRGFKSIMAYINGEGIKLPDLDIRDNIHLPFIDNLEKDQASRAYELAAKLASLYEVYQIYRPEWINAWNEGDTISWLGDENFFESCSANNAAKKQENKASLDDAHKKKTFQENEKCYRWVARLWSEYIRNNCNEGQRNWDRAMTFSRLIERLQSDDEWQRSEIKDKLKTHDFNDIYIFGASSLPPVAFDLLIALGRYINVHFMLVNPCREYWGDLTSGLDWKRLYAIASKNLNVRYKEVDKQESSGGIKGQGSMPSEIIESEVNHYGKLSEKDFNADLENIIANPLLLSLGRQGKDMLSVLTKKMYEGTGENDNVNEVFAFVPFEPSTEAAPNLLAVLQDDILNARIEHREGERALIAADDKSVQICGCAGPLREMQELYDVLMRDFMRDETLTPRDVVVMIPNLKKYVPYIRAVFKTNDSFVTRLNFRICDRSLREENPTLGAVSRLLHLNDTPLKAQELLELISIPEIMKRYGLTLDDLPRVKKFISDGEMVSGLCVDDLERTDDKMKLDDGFPFTIASGLERELEGAFMPKLESDNEVPYLTNVDSYGISVLGHLGCFIKDLNLIRAELEARAADEGNNIESLVSWREFVYESIVSRFFSFESSNSAVQMAIACAFNTLKQNIEHVLKKPKINLPLIRGIIDEVVKGEPSHSSFLDGNLNFCTFVPMRSIPFRRIYMCGLNDGDFPRSTDAVSFDFMSQQFRQGDRSKRDDDRYMFMEGLTAAQESLYISYCSRDQYKGNELNPSVVVNELLDYIVANYQMENSESYSLFDNEVLVTEDLEKQVRNHILGVATLNVFDARNFTSDNFRGSPSAQVFWCRGVSSDMQPKVPNAGASQANGPQVNGQKTSEQKTNLPLGTKVVQSQEKSRTRTEVIQTKEIREQHKVGCIAQEPFMSGRLLPDLNGVLNIDVADLCRFYSQGPAHFFKQKILGLYDERDYEIEKYESMTPSNLDSYEIYYRTYMDTREEFIEYLKCQKSKGRLAAYEVGDEYIDSMLALYDRNQEKLVTAGLGRPQSVDIDTEITIPLDNAVCDGGCFSNDPDSVLGVFASYLSKIYPDTKSLKVHLTGTLGDVIWDEDAQKMDCLELWTGKDYLLRFFFTVAVKLLLLATRTDNLPRNIIVYPRDFLAESDKDDDVTERFECQIAGGLRDNRLLQLLVSAMLVGRVWGLPLLIKKSKVKLSAPNSKNGLLDPDDGLAFATFKEDFNKCLIEGDFKTPDKDAILLFGDGSYFNNSEGAVGTSGSHTGGNKDTQGYKLLQASLGIIRSLREVLIYISKPKKKASTAKKNGTRSLKSDASTEGTENKSTKRRVSTKAKTKAQ